MRLGTEYKGNKVALEFLMEWIQGGIATIPGFGWWPIKAYRPCPGFVSSGRRYKQCGQSMNEVVFGGGKGETSTGTFDEIPSRSSTLPRRQARPFRPMLDFCTDGKDRRILTSQGYYPVYWLKVHALLGWVHNLKNVVVVKCIGDVSL
ncbi:hypothetical protein Ancab_033182 [Ancistrocladus abbreviatus]